MTPQTKRRPGEKTNSPFRYPFGILTVIDLICGTQVRTDRGPVKRTR